MARRPQTKKCSVEGCDKPFLALGLCSMHYYRQQRHGSVEEPPKKKCRDKYGESNKPPGICLIEGCDEVIHARGMCNTHYRRLMRRGDPESLLRVNHGESKTNLYGRWAGMKTRCYLENTRGFTYYGAKGVKVCERWRTSFLAFKEDMGEPPTPEHELDRIDTYGDYCKENCRWVLHVENNQNRRSTKLTKDDVIEIRKSDLPVSELAKEYGVTCSHIAEIRSRGKWKNV